jgi:hypothetical protein
MLSLGVHIHKLNESELIPMCVELRIPKIMVQ